PAQIGRTGRTAHRNDLLCFLNRHTGGRPDAVSTCGPAALGRVDGPAALGREDGPAALGREDGPAALGRVAWFAPPRKACCDAHQTSKPRRRLWPVGNDRSERDGWPDGSLEHDLAAGGVSSAWRRRGG